MSTTDYSITTDKFNLWYAEFQAQINVNVKRKTA